MSEHNIKMTQNPNDGPTYGIFGIAKQNDMPGTACKWQIM